jgi:hypothetical protein
MSIEMRDFQPRCSWIPAFAGRLIVAPAQQPRDQFLDIRNPGFTWISKAPSRAGPLSGNRAGKAE